jgi:osmoprotectant transport system ATP-binding protein
MASPNGGGAALRLRGVGVRYPGAPAAAVHDVDLDIAGGELTVFLGPSGCGKSTLLRTINRLIEPTAGTIAIDGTDVTTLDPVTLRRGIGYVIQAVGLFPHLTIGTNIGIVPDLLSWDKPRIAARVDELLTLVRLDPAQYRDRLPRQLSGGEQQRAGVARALAAEPRLLLMDEPFGAVDAIVRTSLQDEIRAIHRELGTTIVFVTHDVDEALRIADRIVVMSGGTIVQNDVPQQVLEAPANDVVRALVGIDAESRRYAEARPLLTRATP